MTSKKNILALVGMPGSGKSAAAEVLKEKGFTIVRFGDETDRGLKAKGLPLTEENEREYRVNLRRTSGMAAYAIKALPFLEQALEKSGNVAVDGLYSWEEYLFLKEKFPELLVIAVVSDRLVRYARLTRRLTRPLKQEEVMQRDKDEIENLHKGGPIAIADMYLVNNISIEDLKNQLDAHLQKLEI